MKKFFIALLIFIFLGVVSISIWLYKDPFGFKMPDTNLQTYYSADITAADKLKYSYDTSAKNILAIKKDFVDASGRTMFLNGINLGGSSKVPFTPNMASHVSANFFNGKEISFVGRPFPLADADEHFTRLKKWGFRFLRFIITWEAIEHEGPGIYDEEYLDYLYQIIKKADDYGINVFIDPHQDVWSRFSGGDGAPLWTFELAGMSPTNFKESGAAIVHNTHGDPFPHLIWFTNYYKLGAATMFSLFWGGNDFAPDLLVEDTIPIQNYLQQHYIGSIIKVAEKLKDLPNVIGFEVMNEPSSGYIGLHDLNQKISYTYFGNAPTPAQAMFLGSGIPTEVETYSLGNFGINQGENALLNTERKLAWDEGIMGVWRRHGVWDIIGDSAVVIKPNYFAQIEGKAVDFTNDYFKPFVEDFANAMHNVDSEWLIFVEPSIFPFYSPLPDWSNDSYNFVYAGHAYDQFTLATKRFIPWIAIGGEGFVFGKQNVRHLFNDRMASLKRTTAEHLGERPTILGEFGVPLDLNEGEAFNTSDFDDQIAALNINLESVENNLSGYALWNYTADNTNERGDQWNGENLSVFSLSQQTDPSDINSGGRALEAVVRPYAYKVAGNITEHQYFSKEKTFLLRFTLDVTIGLPTEIFLPELHFGEGFEVYTNISKLAFDKENDMLLLSASKNQDKEIIVVVKASEQR